MKIFFNKHMSFSGSRRIQNSLFGWSTWLVGIAICLVHLSLPQLVSASEVPKYGIFELQLRASGTYPNPYLKMPGNNYRPGFVVGNFVGPNGEHIHLDGFWDGGKSWKIRMAPTSVGTWSYKTSSMDAGLNNNTGSFIVKNSASRGFIRVDPEHPHHFQWEDDTPFYWSGTATQIAHFDSRDAQGGKRTIKDGTFQAFARIRKAQGFTTTFWGYWGFNKKQFNSKTQRNEGGPPFINYDPDLLNPAYYQYGDLRVRAILEENIVPMISLGWPDQGIAKFGSSRLKRYWRYLIARYSAYNVIWNLFGEADEFKSRWFSFGNWQSIVNDYGKLTRSSDPYHHLLSTHLTGGPDKSLAEQPWYDFIILQCPVSATSHYLKFGKPVVNAEYKGYEGFQVNAETLRTMLWHIRLRGGYFVYESWGNDLRSTGAYYASLCNRFFQGHTRYWELEYHPELFEGNIGLANPGHEYIAYLDDRHSVKINLSKAPRVLHIQWFNPRTGEIQNGVTTGGTSRAFKAPDSGDWVLHIYRDSPSQHEQ